MSRHVFGLFEVLLTNTLFVVLSLSCLLPADHCDGLFDLESSVNTVMIVIMDMVIGALLWHREQKPV